ncbi:unnamed protein product [Gongylonema pulchrum]|uniref:Glutamate-rich WD repeat-containing protein 1 n=1 Tax=Gongylonema pulchrum TaxID=637853 RepID=A0A183E000_9BILA|nr:unnamed protein product [Gongylonema pulchrum]
MAEDTHEEYAMMEEDEESGAAGSSKKKKKVYIPGVSRPLREDEEWEFDPEAYRMYHSFETKWPCLSFDTIDDELGDGRSGFPLSCDLVGGTQAEKAMSNELIVMRLSNLHPIEDEEASDSEDIDESPDSKEPKMHAAALNQGKVTLWNLTPALQEISAMEGRDRVVKRPKERPLFSFVGHQAEGYALSWSPLKLGRLASGDIRNKIYLWTMVEGGQWVVDQQPLAGHKKSVEDLCWSPTDEAVLASCSVDGTVKLWDTRQGFFAQKNFLKKKSQKFCRSPPSDACTCTVSNAHESDVNVMSWNKFEPLIASGGNDGAIKVWSLKTMQYNEPVARFRQHKAPITSVEWSPYETTTIMASGEDDQVTIWDLALEADSADEIDGVPPQLLFVHMGQSEVKEVHWHKQIPHFAITTALSGFNLFIPSNL